MALTDSEVDNYISEILSDAQWNDDKVSVSDFLSTFSSAQPVRLVPQGREINLGEADLLHPFLAFSRRRRTKAYAENLVWDENTKKYIPQGTPLEIPKDYIGWFEVVKPGQPSNQSCQMTIGDIVNTKCKQFLIRTTAIGHRASENHNEADFQLGEEARVYPGEILKVSKVITKQWKMQAVGEDNPGKKKKKESTAETQFLECIDTKEQYIYLPLAHPGQFYGLWTSDIKSKSLRMDLAYYIYDMLNFGFPLLTRVVFGWPPADYPEFSGFLRILGVNRPDSLILRSMKPGSCVILELPMEAYVKIETMSNLDMLVGNKNFERILSHSCDRIYPYLIGMKHMDTKYPVMHEEEENGKDGKRPDSDPQKHDVYRMARPRDMNHFNPMDIFPPLDEPIRRVAESWTLSFKDPDFVTSDMQELRDSESVLVDPEADSGDLKSKRISVIGGVQEALKGMKIHDRSSGVSRRDQLFHKRGDMEQVLLEREAEC